MSQQIKFILDAHLGRCAKYLRLLGFDVLFAPNSDDADMIRVANSQNRVLLSRDKALLASPALQQGYSVASIYPKAQIKEIMLQFNLFTQVKPFTRCLECNGVLISVNKDSIADSLPERTNVYYQTFNRCNGCGKIYWQGSHYQRMQSFVTEIMVLQP